MLTTGQRIRDRRKELELSADDVAIDLGVSRSTIFRYENGSIEKVPANVLESLADILKTTPGYLMGWEDDPDDYDNMDIDIPTWWSGSPKGYLDFLKAVNEDHKRETNEKQLLQSFIFLNDKNKKKAVSYVENLLSIQRLDAEQDDLLNAAHERTDIEVTAEMHKADDDIMNDDNF